MFSLFFFFKKNTHKFIKKNILANKKTKKKKDYFMIPSYDYTIIRYNSDFDKN